jgi:DNA helicase-2/ATP-dependent DNA helicase PcrA
MRQAYIEYQERCDRAGLVDFAELLLRAHELLRDNPALLAHYRARFGEILVDEFQDTNAIQYAFVRVLAGDSGHVFVVGDDDQAIYGWRGAKVENVQRFLQGFPGRADHPPGAELPLQRQHPRRRQRGDRAQPGPHRQAAVDRQRRRRADRPVRRLQRDGRGALRGRACRQWVRDGGSYTDCAVLYRSNAQSRAFEEALLAEQVPYRVYGGMRFFERAEIKDALAYLRLLANRDDDAAFERAVNTPARGIGERTLDEVRRIARAGATAVEGNAGREGRCSPGARATRWPASHLVNSWPNRPADDPGRAHRPRAGALGLREHWSKEAMRWMPSRAPTTSTNWSRWPRASPAAATDIEEEREDMSELVAFLAYAALEAGEARRRPTRTACS